MSKTTHWGIIAPGGIAQQFAIGLTAVEGASLYSVAGRSIDKAQAFAEKHNAEKYYDDYQAFLADDKLDAIYIATPHPFHKEFAMMCLEAGKAVLCEKPIAMNESELSEMIECAKQNNVFFMEAVWTRFLPATVKIRQLLADKVIGEITRLTADFAFNASKEIRRLYEPELGGGALLDVGIYPVNYATMILGNTPKQILSTAYLGETGVDERASIILDYGNGVMANLYCGITTFAKNEAVIYGEKGVITVHDFWQSQKLRISYFDEREDEVIELPHAQNGYCYEAQEVMSLLAENKKESEIMSLEDSMAVMQIMDKLRADWGLKYPME
ncbi:Gfo/Idh/MocA family protein [Psychromonas sp. KJ10-10]|uniref:Gfo/Idh/MocA family protein n=1 Tax=Psychromonas sp. KJ10-10 TaxID=3391823 RepID=UPI0039B6582E